MIKYHAQFLLDKEKNNPTAKVRYRIKWSGFIVAFSLGYRVEIDKWSLDTQRCKINTSHGKKKIPANIINRKIQEYEQACEQVFIKFNAQNKIPTAEEYKQEFNIYIGKEERIIQKNILNFFDVHSLFIREEGQKNQWSKSTYEKMNTHKKHIWEFDPNFSFENISEQKLTDYLYYLIYHLKLNNITILKEFSLLRWFLRWCKRKKYIESDIFENFRPKLKTAQRKIIFLTQNELKQLRNFEIPIEKKYLEEVRDVFLFLCFTGLRYSDLVNLKRGNIKDNYIHIVSIKTTDNLIIELNKYSKSILEKYKNFTFENGKVLPVLTNQKMNEYLKELTKLVGINEIIRNTYYIGNIRYDEEIPKYALIGTHTGRRTFICNALALGIPPQVVMKWTGHSDYNAMKPYIDIADEIKIKAMERFDLL